jgi:hypothetical protein
MNNNAKQSDAQFQSLLDTVERLRQEKFSHLDTNLVRDLLRLHSDGAAANAELGRGVEQAVERRLTREN